MMESELYREIFSKGERRGKEHGAAEKEAETILRILTRRIGGLDETVRAKVLGERRSEVLDTWYDEALNVLDEPMARRLIERILRTT